MIDLLAIDWGEQVDIAIHGEEVIAHYRRGRHQLLN